MKAKSFNQFRVRKEILGYIELHPTQINTWKREFLDNAESVFTAEKSAVKDDSKEKELYSKIGELQIQVDFLNYLDAGRVRG